MWRNLSALATSGCGLKAHHTKNEVAHPKLSLAAAISMVANRSCVGHRLILTSSAAFEPIIISTLSYPAMRQTTRSHQKQSFIAILWHSLYSQSARERAASAIQFLSLLNLALRSSLIPGTLSRGGQSVSNKDVIPMARAGHNFTLNATVNGAIPLPLFVDSGAETVAIPLNIFQERGVIRETDIIDIGYMGNADGSARKTIMFTI
jgi:hypothetical protein